ncbi:hypothetical protein JQC92_07485 [Shewanella sp. 202IG2-18]|uniref:hypothetical protein n=1 Tax=Parashewanella hymeniacidonis TaxID=2807618 RepID=UPI00195F58C6|nr:hypothetical protein [Parashewanella hymeniacidonis]MBM7071883.1 hypothetical protein [Parashewanella hymeniacidonis]
MLQGSGTPFLKGRVLAEIELNSLALKAADIDMVNLDVNHDIKTHCRREVISKQKKYAQDMSMIVILHLALFWFLASNWQAPDKIEQLKEMQQQVLPNLKAYLYISEKNVESAESVETVIEEPNPQEETEPEPEVKEYAQEKETSEPVVHQPILLETENQTVSQAFNIKAATQSYLQRQRQQQFDAIQSSDAQYRYGSSSEMTPQMKQEWLPARETFADKKVIDHRLDPNRIVRVGNECRRVVKIIDPISGDSESLGYPFKCGKSDQEKALAASLEKYSKKKR